VLTKKGDRPNNRKGKRMKKSVLIDLSRWYPKSCKKLHYTMQCVVAWIDGEKFAHGYEFDRPTTLKDAINRISWKENIKINELLIIR
jgi:hypothetical protein